MENSILVRDICKRYDDFSLEHVSFNVPKGRIVGFIGENGAGKSTTINIILNEINKDSGSVEVLGLDHTVAAVKEKVGVVFDECNFHDLFTPADIERILKGVYKSWDSSLFAEYLKRFNIPAKKTVGSFSKGMILSEEEATYKRYYDVDRVVEKLPFAISNNEIALIYPMSVQQAIVDENQEVPAVFSYKSSDHKQTYSEMEKLLSENHLDTSMLFDVAEREENSRMLIMVINIFSYGFILLISMISIANVFNTMSTNITLRRREFAMLKSIGMSDKSFRKMMNYECMIYGLKSLLWGLPASFVLTYVIFRITGAAFEMQFCIPWYSIAIAVGSVFIVVFATMLYATGKIRKDNPIDALKNENI